MTSHEQWPQILGDPSLVLGKDLMAYIFAFVGSGSGKEYKYPSIMEPTDLESPIDGNKVRLVSLQEAGRLQSFLGRICKRWYKITQECLSSILGPLNITFVTMVDALFDKDKNNPPCSGWMMKHRIRIGSLAVWDIGNGGWLFKNLLQACDTKDMHTCATLSYQFWPPNLQAQLHDTIAQECPNLQELCISFASVDERADLFSKSLFSMPGIRRLHMRLSLAHHPVDNSCQISVVSSWISNLSGLEELRLGGFVQTRKVGGSRCRVKFPVCLLINSITLRTLDVSDLDRNVFVKCRCPRLKSFSCKSSNGTLPDLETREQFRAFQEETKCGLDGTWSFSAETTPVAGLQVPPTCFRTVTDMMNLNNFAGFREHLLKVKGVQEGGP